jgi:hypothetical protein
LSFREIAVTIRAVNQASNEFTVCRPTPKLGNRMKSLGSTIAGIGAAGTAVAVVADQFGILKRQPSQSGHVSYDGCFSYGQFMRASAGVAIAQKGYSAATAFAVAVQNSLNVSFATFLALTGVGLAVIVAAAAAMISFANSMNKATTNVQTFNEAASATPTQTRSILRAGDAELYRRGVE